MRQHLLSKPIMMILDDWNELAGHIASEANDTGDKKLQRRLDTIFSKIQDLLDSHDRRSDFRLPEDEAATDSRSRSNSPNGLRGC